MKKGHKIWMQHVRSRKTYRWGKFNANKREQAKRSRTDTIWAFS